MVLDLDRPQEGQTVLGFAVPLPVQSKLHVVLRKMNGSPHDLQTVSLIQNIHLHSAIVSKTNL